MSKKIISLLISVLMCCSLFAMPSVSAQTQVSVSGGTGVESYHNAIDTTKSLILHKKPISKIKYDSANPSSTYFNIYESDGETILTDDKYNSGNVLWGRYEFSFMEEIAGVKTIINDENRFYVQLNYALDGVADITKVGIYGHNSNDLTPYHFKVSFANTAGELFSNTATTYDVYNESGNHYMVVSLPQAAEAKYFGIRVICGVMPAATNRALGLNQFYGRIGHISLEGTYKSPVNKDVTASSEVEGINASVAFSGGVTDKLGNYASGAKATLSLDKTELTDGNKVYKFKGWYQGDVLVSSSAEYTVPLTESAQSFVAKFEYTIDRYSVKFIGRSGKVDYVVTVDSGEKVTQNDITAALSAAGGYYGYKAVGLERNIASETITANCEVAVVYERDKSLACAVTYNGAPVAADGFDAKVSLTNTNEVVWYINGEKYSVGSSCVLYTCGDMTVTTKALGSTDKNAPFVSIIQTLSKDGNMYAFATAYEGNKTISELGVVFTSTINADIQNSDWTEAVLLNVSYAKAKVNDIDIMAVLTDVSEGKDRLAQAYAKFSDGTTVYSATKTINY